MHEWLVLEGVVSLSAARLLVLNDEQGMFRWGKVMQNHCTEVGGGLSLEPPAGGGASSICP